MKRYSLIAFVAFLLTVPSIMASASDGDNALPFVRVNHDPVSAAMGGAGVVNPSAYSSFRNTAALTYWDKTFDVGAGYQSWSSAETQNIFLGAGWKLGKVALSLGGNYGMGAEYDVYDSNGAENGTFRTSEMQINLGAAWKFLPFLSIGADFKYLSNTVASGSSLNAFAADVFLMTKLSDFRIAAGVSSIGTDVKSESGGAFALPTSITVGAGYDHTFAEKHGVNVALDLDYYYSAGEFIGALGAEYSYKKMVFVRAGYHYADDTAVIPSYASVGVGVQFIGIRLDFAYMLATSSNSLLKDTITIGLGYSF